MLSGTGMNVRGCCKCFLKDTAFNGVAIFDEQCQKAGYGVLYFLCQIELGLMRMEKNWFWSDNVIAGCETF